ncbi:crotonase/enoyl-CoA hydratase family protein [Thalassotalea sp. G2M2-11]|uniref:crotonase/enoyl-CoA hydratase family protein n=1 Tax=Thalassotalea sp. G2M2-11 TaxID=2787627 RepID=UPI0019D1A8DC|nr:crotonase/enoyl-CoA hydratase family protein [Thalassotalea sp. G2M2-11]
MDYQYITVTLNQQIANVELARPEKHNAINMTLFKELIHLAKSLRKDRQLRAVIISGQGEDFCSGIDIKSLFGSSKNAMKLLFKVLPWRSNKAQQVSTLWRDLPVPVIFALHGKCWGAGLQIALGGDFRIATPDASLSIMEARWGLIPDMGGNIALKELMPIDQAKLLAMSGKELSGHQALALNLLTQVAEDPLQAATQLANQLSHCSPDSIAGCKKLYNRTWQKSNGLTLAKESWYQIKILLGKNYLIKGANQRNADQPAKPFKARSPW